MQISASAVTEHEDISLRQVKGIRPWNLWFNDELQRFMRNFSKDLDRELIGQRIHELLSNAHFPALALYHLFQIC